MQKAISDYKIVGLKTTLPFGEFVCAHEQFIKGTIDTHFVKKYFSAEKFNAANLESKKIAASVALKIYLEEQKKLIVAENENEQWFNNRS